MHTAGMPSLLAHCRLALSRHRGFRVLWVLTVLGLLLGGMPRWEMHQHEIADHDHGHHHLASADDAAEVLVQIDDIDDKTDAVLTHLHAMPSLSIALIDASLPVLRALIHPAPAVATVVLTAPAERWPPPYRPPIA